MRRRAAARLLLVAVLLGTGGACVDRPEPTLPTAEEVEGYYEYGSELDAAIVGNVAVLTVEQDAEQLRRGGRLWAMVGPYIFLFTEETRQLLEDHPGLAAVRVNTRVGSARVATALLPREEMPDILWRRSLNIAGKARRDGSARPTLLEALVAWGEAHTEYSYDERFTRR
ncbi:MAG: hypothetical protein R3304_08150 [Longimicrobiales bacterium]|nr:hypothetical protein [Longimicrobiales bacterium]